MQVKCVMSYESFKSDLEILTHIKASFILFQTGHNGTIGFYYDDEDNQNRKDYRKINYLILNTKEQMDKTLKMAEGIINDNTRN